MPCGNRHCATCLHPEKGRIEFKLAAGEPVAAIARAFGLSERALHRHWANHVSQLEKVEMVGGKAVMANLAERSRAEDRSLLDYLAILRSSLMRLFLDAQKKGDKAGAGMISQRLLAVLEVTGKITGEIREAANGTTVNILNANGSLPPPSAEMARVQGAVIGALRPYPDARAAVIQALDALADKETSSGAVQGALAAPAGTWQPETHESPPARPAAAPGPIIEHEPPAQTPLQARQARDAEIAEKVKAGAANQQLAAEFGISEARVRQITGQVNVGGL